MLTQQALLIFLCFVVYYVSSFWISRQITNPVTSVVMQRLTGFGLLLIPSLIYFSIDSIIIEDASVGKSIAFIFIFSSLAVIVNGLRKRSDKDTQMYPHMRVTSWSTPVAAVNALTWMIYLFPYEFVFRGTLLNASLASMGPWTAFMFNAITYALVHAPQGPRETIASLPFGVLLSFISYATGNFWSAYFIHVALALSNDYFAIRHNARIKFISTLTRQLWPSTKKITP